MNKSVETMEQELLKLETEYAAVNSSVQPEIDRLNNVLAGLNELFRSSRTVFNGIKTEDDKDAFVSYARGIAESKDRINKELQELQSKPKSFVHQIAEKKREIEEAKKSRKHKMKEKVIRGFFDSTLSFQEKFDKLEQFFANDFNDNIHNNSYGYSFATSAFVKKYVQELLEYKYSATQAEKMMEIAADFVYKNHFGENTEWNEEPHLYFGAIEVAMKVIDSGV